MSYEPLHHKYRPQTFGELVGQEAIAATLTNAIQQQRIAPAYLFTGARGTGKTSSARILAKSLNCISNPAPTATPCGKCEICTAIARGAALDIVEIDAASNTGVDNIRELIERAQFAPVQCRYKVYIIDEVHMLSTAAFNALLKTLEEPPDRVVFVLATTDPQRVLPTIISRCQRFDYRRIPLNAMIGHLSYIATQETIPITPEAVTLVAQIAQGGLRDAESLLDQLSLLAGEITADQVWDLVGSVPERDLLDLVRAIASDDPERLLESTRRLMDRGREPLIVLQNLASFYRDLLIAKTAPARNDLVALTPPTWDQLCALAQDLDRTTISFGQQQLRTAEGQLKHTTQPRLWLEVTLLGLLPSAITAEPAHRARQGASNGHASQPQSKPRVEVSQPEQSIPSRRSEAEGTGASSPSSPPETSSPPSPGLPKPPEAHPVTANASPTARDRTGNVDLEHVWQEVIRAMVPYSTQVMVRQQCQLQAFDGKQARIAVKTQPLLKIAQGKLPNLESAFETVFNRQIHITLEVAAVAPSAPHPPATPPTHQPPPPKHPDPTNLNPANPTAMPSVGPPPPPPPSPSQPPTHPTVRPPLPHRNDAPEVSPNSLSADDAPPPFSSTDPAPIGQGWETEDEVTKAAKNLAAFFNGSVVDLEDSMPQVHDMPQDARGSESIQHIGSAQGDRPEDLFVPGDLNLSDEDEDDEDLPF